jgi:putative two-component system response regulator
LFVGVSVAFYDADTHFREQLPLRLVFFVLTGFVGISLAAELRKRRENLQAKTRQSLSMLAQVVEARDPFSGMHLKHIQHYSRALALRLGLDEAEADEVAYAAMIHDVGKAQIADAILKKNGPLTLEERQEMQLHTELSDVILADEEDFRTARDVARWHHERWDGTGYPEGLAGEQIPFAARIVSVADVYDALVSRRSYKEPWPAADAIMEIRRQSGAQFDPKVVEAFVELYATNVLRDLDLEMNRKADDEAAAALERPHPQAA